MTNKFVGHFTSFETKNEKENVNEDVLLEVVDFTTDAEVEIAFNVAGEDVAISGRIEGDYVAPDAHSYTQEFSFAGISGSEAAVIIGGEA